MFIVKVTNNATSEVQQSDFSTEQERTDWIESCENALSWGPLDSYTKELSVLNVYEHISPRQIRLGLLALGKVDADIETAINALSSPDKEAAMIAWKYSTYFERSIPIVESIGTALGLDSEELDALWVSAKAL